MKISNKQIGSGHKCFVIAEIGQAHDGSLGFAHAYIDAVAEAGADAVKFQTHIAHAESSKQEPWRVKFSYQDDSRYDYWKRMEFTKQQWAGLKDHAEEKGLIFLSSPFSIEAIEMLDELGVVAWKVASGEVDNEMFLNRLAETKKPILLSSGMSSLEEIDKAVLYIKNKQIPIGIFQCTTSYPVNPENIGLNVIPYLMERYECPVGLSDHSGTIYPSICATYIGASMVEVHVKMSEYCFGPDVSSSITIDNLKEMIKGIRFVEIMKNNPVDKDQMTKNLETTKKLFSRSLGYKNNLNKGDIIKRSDISLVKPGSGIKSDQIDRIVNRKLARNIKAGNLISLEDLEDSYA